MRVAPLLLCAGLLSPASAAEWLVAAGDPETALQATVDGAAAGDTIRVRGGRWRGPLRVDRALRLIGEDWPVIDGGGQGTVVSLLAPETLFSGFEVRGSGALLDRENSGIAVEAPGALVEGNRLADVLFGIYLRRAGGSTVRGNVIDGKELPLPRRGDAIRVWYSDGVTIEDNEVTASRDVVLWYSRGLSVRRNRIRAGRYGLHFMYCDDATIESNLLYENSVGAFLMYSRRLRLVANTIAANHGPSGYGMGLKDMDDAVILSNLFAGNRVGAFLDNSPREIASRTEIAANVFAANDVGVLLLPNVRRADLSGNSFAENRQQVEIAGSGADPEANAWRGNYWSDYAGFDANRDGVGDLPYRSDRLFEELAGRRPELRLFAQSPATEALDFAARAFPVVLPRPKLVDPLPRMTPPELAAVPALPRLGSGAWGRTAAALLAGALLLVALPRLAGSARGPRAADGGPLEGAPSEAGRPGRARPAVAASGLAKSFGDRPALRGLTFDIAEGESVALWGPNGAGKTTALRAMLGVLPFEGTLRVGGRDPRREGREVRRRIGFVPQEIGLRSDWDVTETLDFFARLRRAPQARIDELLSWLGLEPHADKSVRGLSGGLKQRLALGLALLADPPLLLLDEPTANLDPGSRSAFRTLLRELNAAGKTLVFTSHRADEVRGLADRVLHLDDGRLVEAGAPEDLDFGAGDGAELTLEPAPEQIEAAAAALAGGGFPSRRRGERLIVPVEPDRAVEALALLLRRGVEIRDLGLRTLGGDGGDDDRSA